MRTRAPAALLLLGLAAPGLATAGKPTATAHELVQAEVDGLLQRLSASPGEPREVPPAELREARAPRRSGRAHAGVALEEADLHLAGQPPAVLTRFLALARAGLAIGSPLAVELAGPELRLTARLFVLPPGARPDPGAPPAELVKLRDNLAWLESRVRSARRLAVLVGALVDSEGVRLESARLARRKLRVAGAALVPEAREGYIRLLTRRCRALPHPPALELDDLRVIEDAPAEPAALLRLVGAPLLDALAWLSPVTGGEEYLALEPAPAIRLDLSLAALPREGLLPALLARAGVAAGSRDGALLVPPSTGAAAAPGGGRPIDLFLPRAPARDLLRALLGSQDQALVLGPGAGRLLGARLARRSADSAAALALDALGLELHRAPGLALTLPRGAPGPAPSDADPVGAVDILALEAPTAALIAGLLGEPGAPRCPPGSAGTQTFAARGVDKRALLAALRASLSAPSGAAPADCPPAMPLRLVALLGRAGEAAERRALFQEGDLLRWLGPGGALQDGRRVRAVTRFDVTLEDVEGCRERLRPTAATEPRSRALGADQTRHPIARLRLVGTLRPPGKPAEALLLTPDGTALRVRVGAPLGTRCGEVRKIGPEGIEVRLGCPLEEEPRVLRLGFF